MANIYDMAKISSGDPLYRSREGAREASTHLAQYKHQKDIIEEINAAIAEAESRAKKGKGLFGLGGGMLGTLLGAGLAATPMGWMGSALGSALGAGIGEKARQDSTRATAPLKRIEAKMKGRKQYEDVKRTRESVQDVQKGSMLENMLISGALGGIFGGSGKPGAVDFSQGPLAPEHLKIAKSSAPINDLLGLIPGMPKEIGSALVEKLSTPGMSKAIRMLGPGLHGAYKEEQPFELDRYSGPQFRNPYRGGY